MFHGGRGRREKRVVFFHGQSCIFSQWAKCPMGLWGGWSTPRRNNSWWYARRTLGGGGGISTPHHASWWRIDRPAEQKRLGREVRRAITAGWDFEKWDVVREGNLAKFRQNSGAREQLFWTKGRILVEASPTDLVWEAGVKMYDWGRDIRGTWKGKNCFFFVDGSYLEQLLLENGGVTSLPQGWKELCRKRLWGWE